MSNSFHTGFVCVSCGARFAPGQTDGACPACGGNLDATYDYARIGREVDPRAIADATDRSIWRFAPFLPVDPARALAGAGDVIRQVGNSPLIRARRLEARLGARAIWLKDDGRLPSASFKDRASAMVVARAIEAGRTVIATASSGNAAAALAVMSACAGPQAVIFVPRTTPEGKLSQMLIHGARVYVVDGTYDDAVRMCAEACAKFGWWNRSTGVNPFTREGKKTAGLEIAEQLGRAEGGAPFRAPDAVIVPVGDGNIISGVCKGFRELFAAGWIEAMPRFYGVTATLAPSLYRAWQAGVETFDLIEATTIAGGISVDRPNDGAMAIRAVRDTGGIFIEATDTEMLAAMPVLAQAEGVFVEPACAAAWVGLEKALTNGLIRPDEEVVLQLTGSGLKDIRSALAAAAKPTVIRSVDDVDNVDNVDNV
jgi:threonine synthase